MFFYYNMSGLRASELVIGKFYNILDHGSGLTNSFKGYNQGRKQFLGIKSGRDPSGVLHQSALFEGLGGADILPSGYFDNTTVTAASGGRRRSRRNNRRNSRRRL